MKNLYDILQVSENASDEIIEKAYRTLAKKYHPDLQPDEKKQTAEAMMKTINEAYEILSDPKKKEEYDRQREEIRQAEEDRKNAEMRRKYEQQQKQQYQQQYQQQQQTYYEPREQYVEKQEIHEEPKEDENLAEYMGSMFKQTFSNQKRQKKRIQNAYREGYQDAYANFWRSQGYRVRKPWTWKRVKELLKSIGIFSLVLLAIWIFPPTRNFIIETYESNEMLKGIVDFITGFFKNFFASLWDALFVKD